MSETLLSSPAPHAPAGDAETVLFDGHPALVPSFGALLLAVLTLGLFLLPLWFRSRSRHYRITTRRVVVESGILGKRLEQVDLYRVNDYTVVRPLGQRLLGTGNLILRTLDKNTPTLDLFGIKADVVDLYEKVRAATEVERQKRGGLRVMEME